MAKRRGGGRCEARTSRHNDDPHPQPLPTRAHKGEGSTHRVGGTGDKSHRLEGAIELDVDEHGLALLECMGNEIGRLVHGLGALGPDT